MKIISWRKFRASFPEYAEPIQVSRRGEEGEVIVMGTWTPLNASQAIHAAIQAAGFGTSRPAPKPKR
jgi:hypothetical protein